MPERQALLWAVAVRRQLDRWEPLAALHLGGSLKPPSFRAITSEEMWRGEIEHHFHLIAAGKLLQAIPLLSEPPAIDPTVRAELKEVRDLLEHWTDDMPLFNVTPQKEQTPPGIGPELRRTQPGQRSLRLVELKQHGRTPAHPACHRPRSPHPGRLGHRHGARSSPGARTVCATGSSEPMARTAEPTQLVATSGHRFN